MFIDFGGWLFLSSVVFEIGVVGVFDGVLFVVGLIVFDSNDYFIK